MKALAKHLTDARKSGVYSLTREPGDIERAAEEAGLKVLRIDIGGASGKKEFLARFAQALNFPTHFGNNWDALNDSLSDFDVLADKNGYVLILENAGVYGSKHEGDLQSAISVLDSAAEFWKDEGRPFWAFIQGAPDSDYHLPKWPQ